MDEKAKEFNKEAIKNHKRMDIYTKTRLDNIESIEKAELIKKEDLHSKIEKMPLNQKAINSIINTGYLNVWEGSVRSSKTVSCDIAFILYMYFSPDNYFIMSGKTIAALYKNCIGGDYGMLGLFRGYVRYVRDSEGNRMVILKGHDNNIKTAYCFGAYDESSYETLRGLTAGGWMADEVNLHPKSFIDEAFRRTIVSNDRKHFWTLNPDNPYHFIYSDYIDKYQKEKLPGFYLWFFNLDDNPSLTEERKNELKSQYSGLFYRRYILGERCIAEGAIYDMFDNRNKYSVGQRPDFSLRYFTKYIAIDYGTTNPCVFLEIYDNGEITYVDREYYWDSKKTQRQKTDEEYCDDLELFIKNSDSDESPECILDPSAESFSVALKKRGIYVTDANNEVENGIRRVATLLGNKTLKINERCVNTIREITTYSWDEKKSLVGEEKPIKQNDHTCDALRYMVNTRIPTWRVGES